jgi:hypothetical protein
MKTTNRTKLDLNKVQHATFFYRNQFGNEREIKPTVVTSRNVKFSPAEIAFPNPNFPNETMLERAIRLRILDMWTPVIKFQLTANHSIEYTGKKAIALNEAWNARIFGKKKGK